MSKVIELSDEQYQTIEQVAATRGQTPTELFAEWIEDLRGREGEARYYETDDWFRHLGATEQQISESKRIAQARYGLSYADP